MLTVDPSILLDDARREGDRGRVYGTKIELELKSNAKVRIVKCRGKR